MVYCICKLLDCYVYLIYYKKQYWFIGNDIAKILGVNTSRLYGNLRNNKILTIRLNSNDINDILDNYDILYKNYIYKYFSKYQFVLVEYNKCLNYISDILRGRKQYMVFYELLNDSKEYYIHKYLDPHKNKLIFINRNLKKQSDKYENTIHKKQKLNHNCTLEDLSTIATFCPKLLVRNQ